MNEEVIYFSVNNWFCGIDYPPTKNFKKWMGDDLNQQFTDNEWCKENKLCVYWGVIDISQNYTIAAPRSWVENNCPELLTDEYSDFVDTPDENGNVTARFGWPYLEYKEENFGCHWYDDEEEWDDEENED